MFVVGLHASVYPDMVSVPPTGATKTRVAVVALVAAMLWMVGAAGGVVIAAEVAEGADVPAPFAAATENVYAVLAAIPDMAIGDVDVVEEVAPAGLLVAV